MFDTATGGGGAVENKFVPPFTVPVDATMDATTRFTLYYFPFVADQLIGGYLYPDKAGNKRDKFVISDNDHNTITVTTGSDMTTVASATDPFMVVARVPLELGRNGNADIVDSDYITQAWDVNSSPFNRIAKRGFGLVKMASPGVTATAVEKAGVAYAAAKNHQWRYHIPSSTLTEAGADAHISDTLGRSDYAVAAFPAYAYKADPVGGREGKMKLVPLHGMIHGREARWANDYGGYHQPAAGEAFTLPAILKLPTGEAELDEEILNPRGIQIIKKLKGNFVVWGNRTLWTDANWRYKHQRELMSYYEQVLMESFDWIIFQLNNRSTQKKALSALNGFFLPEWQKGALDADLSYTDAAFIKIDGENNTRVTKAAGDMFADIGLALADAVERFRIRIGKQGINTSVG